MATIYTEFLKIPFPDAEEQNPSYELFQSYTEKIEGYLYMATLMKNFFLAEGGDVTWDGGIMRWTTDFYIPVFFWGKRFTISYGPDSANRYAVLQNGQALVVEIPSVPNTNALIFSVVSQLDQAKPNQWVAGWALNGRLYLNGLGEISV